MNCKLTQSAGAGRPRSNVVLTVDHLHTIILHRRFDRFPMDSPKNLLDRLQVSRLLDSLQNTKYLKTRRLPKQTNNS